MIQQHVGAWYWNGPSNGQTLTDAPILALVNASGGLAAPIFLLCSGIVSALPQWPRPFRWTTVRAASLFLIAYVLNLILVPSFDFSTWYILHLLATASLIDPVLRRFPRIALLVLAAALVAFAAVAQSGFGQSGIELTRKESFGGVWHFLDRPLRSGQFPILPWMSIYVGGVWIGRRLRCGQPAPKPELILAVAGVIAGAIVGISHLFPGSATAAAASSTKLPFFPASALVIVLLGGVTAAITSYALRREGMRSLGFLVAAGQCSLSLLVAHMAIFRGLPQRFWRTEVFVTPAALAIAIAASILAVLAAKAWTRVGFRWSLENGIRGAAAAVG